jgi:ribonuclease VapC
VKSVPVAAEHQAVVLDSFALLAHFEGEPGGRRVAEILASADRGGVAAHLSIINFGEVLYIAQRERGLRAAQRVVAAIDQLPIAVAEADRRRTFSAASLKAEYPIAYADAFALGLALELDAAPVTGDPEFASVDLPVTIEWLQNPR